jgi:hypothetical protein
MSAKGLIGCYPTDARVHLVAPLVTGRVVRVPSPVPSGVVVCLCCGWLPVKGTVGDTATRHTATTAHPTIDAAEEL